MPCPSSRLRLCIGAGLAALLAACAAPPPEPVTKVDLPRLSGTWYQLAALPTRAEAHCDSDTQWQLSPEAEGLRRRTHCLDRDGRPHQHRAHIVTDPASAGTRWQVADHRALTVDQWVLALDPDYRWALIGDPGRREAWLLARSTWLPPTVWDAAWQQAEQQGFVRQDFRVTPQFGRTEGPPPPPRPR